MVLLPQYRPLEDGATTHADDGDVGDVGDDNEFGDDSDDSDEEDMDPTAADQDRLVDLEEDVEEDFEDVDGFISDMQSAMDIFHEQEANGNIKFVEKFIAANVMNQRLVEEIQRLKNRCTMPLTWAHNRHPATMYYH